MKKASQASLVALFFLLLSAPLLNERFGFVRFGRAYENRRFHDSLSISLSHLDQFPKDCEAYVNDNFSFRGPLIAFYKRIKFYGYGVSPNPDQLIIGKNGRYFIAGDEKKIYEGEMNFTQQELSMMEASWLKRKHYFDSIGVPVYVMLCPTGLEIYPEDLPFYIRKRDRFNRFDQVEKQFRKRLPGLIVNPVNVLKAGKKKGKVYFTLDNHWTEFGGFLASRQLLERMQREHFPQLDLSFLGATRWKNQRRDFGHFVDIAGVPGLAENIPLHTGRTEWATEAPDLLIDFNSEGVAEEEKQRHFIQQKPKNKLKILVIRDSFGEALYPFLKEPFAESLFIFDAWSYGLNRSVIAQYRPDVVVYVTYDPGIWKYINPADN